jgi:hypothetical protein
MVTVGKPKAMRYAIATNCLFGGADGEKAGVESNEEKELRNFSGRQRRDR